MDCAISAAAVDLIYVTQEEYVLRVEHEQLKLNTLPLEAYHCRKEGDAIVVDEDASIEFG